MDKDRTKFSKFANSIYKFKKDDNGLTIISFTKDLFKSTGYEVCLSDDLAKLIFTGHRIISKAIKEVIKKHDINSVALYLKSVLNLYRIKEIFKEFEIDEDEKVDEDIFLSALANQFFIFIKYEEEEIIPTSVKSIYEALLDNEVSKDGGDPNLKALIAAKEMFYGALVSLEPLTKEWKLNESRIPIQNFLDNCYKVFRCFEIKCDHLGKNIYRRIKDTYFKKNDNENFYLKLISEIGSLPLELGRRVEITLYTLFTFQSRIFSSEFSIERDYTDRDLHDLLHSIKHKSNEVPFSEEIIIHLKNSKRNLIPDLLTLLKGIQSVLDSFEKDCGYHLAELDKRIKDKLFSLLSLNVSFIWDGTYYPEKDKIQFAPNFQIQFGNDKLVAPMVPGEDIIPFKRTPDSYFIQGKSFIDDMKRTMTIDLTILNGSYSGKQQDLLNEFIIYNPDDTYRYYMYLPTCKANTYRYIQKVAHRVKKENSIAFIGQTIMTWNKLDQSILNMSSDERVKKGKDMIYIFGYFNGKYYLGAEEITPNMKPFEIKETNVDNFPTAPKLIVYNIIQNEKKGIKSEVLKL